MSEKYDISSREPSIQNMWRESGVYAFDANTEQPIYSIDTPPPTVSGKIHIGHIFSYTQAEVIARYKRMLGNTLFYPFGFDDNGLPTEKLVEKEIGKKSSQMVREEFNQECLRVTQEYREKFKVLRQSMWFSVDRDLSYSTISPETQRVSQLSFLKLLKKWKLYSKVAPTLRCPECQTAIAQAEVERKTMPGVFYDIAFSLESWEPITISTTRPELLGACVAVFVNPEDERYTDLVGQTVITPLGKAVKILADDKVDVAKGTGIVMCCSYGDETDMYWVKKYGLEEHIILDRSGNIINTGDTAVDGMYYKKARKIIVEWLKATNKILDAKDIQHDVGTHERCSTPIEILTVKQWFIKTLDLKTELIEAGDKIKWNPKHMKKRYTERVENLKWDRCISRQRYFGIPIPVRYSKKTGEAILPDEDQLPVNPITGAPKTLPANHTLDDIYPEMDVLDTRATSSLTPLINSWYFEHGEKNIADKIHPMDLRPQAHDIIRTRALYTIIMSLYHTWDIPFKSMMISGHVLAGKSEKISKSKDNAGATPEQLIAKYGADPIRYRACGGVLGKDITFDEKEIENWRRLVTKLWNAARFVNLNLADFSPTDQAPELQTIDRWIIEKSEEVGAKMSKHLNEFNVGWAVIEFEKFFWSDFCDNYLEIVKLKISNPERFENWEAQKKSSQYALYISMFNILKLIAPVVPHITEEIYQNNYRPFEQEISVHKLSYPKAEKKSDVTQELYVKELFELIDLIRKNKTEQGIKYGHESRELIITWTDELLEKIRSFESEIKSIARSENVSFTSGKSLSAILVL